MKIHLLTALIILGIGTVSAQPNDRKQIPVAEVGRQVQIIGLLGLPLGEKIEITGTAPSQPMMISNPIKISIAAGKREEKDIQIEVGGALQIEKGFSYTIVGYESGGFVSSPFWTSSDGTPPQQSFQFRTFFVPVKVIEKKKL